VHKEIFSKRVYTQHGVTLPVRGGCVFDVGANIGMFSVFALREHTQVSFLTDAKSSLGDAKSSLGDAESSLGDTKSSLGDAESSLGDAKSSLGDIPQGHLTVFAFEPIPPVAHVLRANVALHGHPPPDESPAQAEGSDDAPSHSSSASSDSRTVEVVVMPVGLSSETQDDVPFLYHPFMTLWSTSDMQTAKTRAKAVRAEVWGLAAAENHMQVSSLGDAKSWLGDAESSLGDA
jgi:hypothetical protein